jgi:hypothetical protein
MHELFLFPLIFFPADLRRSDSLIPADLKKSALICDFFCANLREPINFPLIFADQKKKSASICDLFSTNMHEPFLFPLIFFSY